MTAIQVLIQQFYDGRITAGDFQKGLINAIAAASKADLIELAKLIVQGSKS